MPHTLFIADLHLDPDYPANRELFLRFLAERAPQADALYILGDLFEVWIGDDDPTPEHAEVISSIRELTDAGTPVFVMHGNRDFLLRKVFAWSAGCKLIEDPTVVDLYGTSTLLMHGDTLCTADMDYLQFRKIVRNPLIQEKFLHLSVPVRRVFARQMRDASRNRGHSSSPAETDPQVLAEVAEFAELLRGVLPTGLGRPDPEKEQLISDVDEEEVRKVMRYHRVQRLIHGHTHRPGRHDFNLDGHPAERLVLGEWLEQGSVLVCTPDGCTLETTG
jgi:UDP-2,3-diacylglucosamine hydrolase